MHGNLLETNLKDSKNCNQQFYNYVSRILVFNKIIACKVVIFSNREVRERSFLNSCLSHALDIQENNLALLIDEHKYVMTLDYAVKMLSVHERSKCGVPVIINGETGVGKTFLLEMLSLLWNQPILSAINHQKSKFQELLVQKLEAHDTDETKVVLDAIKNNKWLHLEQLEDVLVLQDPQKPSKRLYDVLSSELLDRQYSCTTFGLIEFPTNLDGNGSVINLFQQVSSRIRSEVRCESERSLLKCFEELFKMATCHY